MTRYGALRPDFTFLGVPECVDDESVQMPMS